MLNKIRDIIEESEYILIGIGEEWDSRFKPLEVSEEIDALLQSCEKDESLQWIRPFLLKELMGFGYEQQSAYQNLLRILEQKNYFIVSTCIDGNIWNQGFDNNRIVTPCGDYEKLQCSDRCTEQLFEINDSFNKDLNAIIKGELHLTDLTYLQCPYCGKGMTYNNIHAENYIEARYLPQWEVYMKWLQNTLNKKICVIELGVGMKYPSVIRWPFERIARLNEKSYFFRIHEKLYQIPEEIKGRTSIIARNSVELLS